MDEGPGRYHHPGMFPIVILLRSFQMRKAISVAISFGLLIVVTLISVRANAEELRIGSCAEELHRFIATIDNLFAKNEHDYESFWSAIREHLPADGCAASEVISISTTSRFFEGPPYEMKESFVVLFRNADTSVSFELQKSTGKIGLRSVYSRHTSW